MKGFAARARVAAVLSLMDGGVRDPRWVSAPLCSRPVIVVACAGRGTRALGRHRMVTVPNPWPTPFAQDLSTISSVDRTGWTNEQGGLLVRGESGAVGAGRGRGSHIVVYYNGTFVNGRNGAHSRMTSLLRFLVRSGHAVTLFSYANHPTEPWTQEAQDVLRREFPTVRLVLDTWTPTLRRLAFAKNVLVSFFPRRSAAILRWRRRGAAPAYDDLVAAASDATWIVNYSDGITQLNGAPRVGW